MAWKTRRMKTTRSTKVTPQFHIRGYRFGTYALKPRTEDNQRIMASLESFKINLSDVGAIKSIWIAQDGTLYGTNDPGTAGSGHGNMNHVAEMGYTGMLLAGFVRVFAYTGLSGRPEVAVDLNTRPASAQIERLEDIEARMPDAKFTIIAQGPADARDRPEWDNQEFHSIHEFKSKGL